MFLLQLFGRKFLKRLFQIVRIFCFEYDDIVRGNGIAVFAQGKIHAVFLGAGLKQADVLVGDLNIGQRGPCLLYTSRCV